MLQTTDDERGTYDPGEFSDELERAPSNHDIGTALWFEDDKIRVFESRLEPGQRAPFHVHDKTYFWTVVDSGRGLQRFADGNYVVHGYELGETKRLEHSASETLIHDLENVGDTTLRFVTVEFKD
jgi:beta-alanine degradation protein BauB